jgi:FAD/FMN-containing dehydrogenase
MNRRDILKSAAGGCLADFARWTPPPATATTTDPAFSRVRPGDPRWPSEVKWDGLNEAVQGRLVKLSSPLDVCRSDPDGDACKALFNELRNPYFISDDVALTQTSGWIDAWNSVPSAYAIRARTTDDVVQGVNFARENKLRLVVKGGGHSYQGTSNSADSLLIWTHEMNDITLHDAFVPRGCDATHSPQPAVTVESGARWLQVYNAVTTRGGRYVQGGGCATVGVAGFIHGAGFGSFSKKYGLGAAGLLEAEFVTADGGVLIVNACNYPDLFWAIKGGGGGSFGVLTKLTLRTRELPATFGGAFASIKATSDSAFRDLIAKTIRFYADNLFNSHWGEQIAFGGDNTVQFYMVSQGLDQAEAERIWAPFWAAITASPSEFTVKMPLTLASLPAQRFWDADYLAQHQPSLILMDNRPAAPRENVFYAGDSGQVGFFIHGYRSGWLPASLLEAKEQNRLVEAIFLATRHWRLALHCNKGLAGAPAEEIEAARDTAMNPAVLNAFALAIIAGDEPPAFPGLRDHEPDTNAARANAQTINRCADELLKIAPGAGSYISESDYFEVNWKQSFWGPNYPRLAAIKKRYDPDGLFFTHHGVGSDEWNADGFTRLTMP